MHRVLKPGGRAGILDFNPIPEKSMRSRFQKFYLKNIVVPIAEKFGLKEQYIYLEKSLKQFPKGNFQERLAFEAGFKEAEHHLIAFGQMGILFLKS